MNSWNELMCLSVLVYPPGTRYSETSEDYYLCFFPEGKDIFQPDLDVENTLTGWMVDIVDKSFCFPFFTSGTFENIDATSFFDCFGSDKEEILPLWEPIKKEALILMGEEKKVAGLPYRKPASPKRPLQFSITYLVRVWFDFDDYTQESDGGVEIIREFDINKIKDEEKES